MNETITINKEDLKYILFGLLDIAEECYPKYSSSDFILECDDFIKENLEQDSCRACGKTDFNCPACNHN